MIWQEVRGNPFLWLILVAMIVGGIAFYASLRPQICDGVWNAGHTTLYLENCHVDW